MPKQKRWAIKATMDGIINEVEKQRDRLVELANTFKEHHPDYAECFFQLAAHLDNTIKPLNALRDAI